MQAQTPKLFTLAEVSETLGRSRSSIYRDVAAGRIPKPVKIGSSVRWPSNEIAAVVDRLVAERDKPKAA
ncbi:MAG: helix-turn-helix domain-containing protein [Proteobacteria bacterium]|nr:helix-turn-helix domain-containing protein [Pseudomonadota bacterium]